MPCGSMAVDIMRFKEKRPGSQPREMMARWPLSFAARSTSSKCAGILACVSKLLITVKWRAYSGVCVGKSVALPPQSTMTSILSFQLSASESATTGTFSV